MSFDIYVYVHIYIYMNTMYLLVDAKSLWREAEMCVVDLESALFLAPVADANEAPPGQHLNAAAHAAAAAWHVIAMLRRAACRTSGGLFAT